MDYEEFRKRLTEPPRSGAGAGKQGLELKKRRVRPLLTLKRRNLFLGAYAECGMITESARRAGVSTEAHYLWLKDPDYKRAFEEAENRAVDRMADEAHRRAVEGNDEPIVYQGEIQRKLDADGKPTGEPETVRRYSDNLLMFLMKGARPEKYRDTWKGEIAHSGTTTVIQRNPDLARLTNEQLNILEGIALQAQAQALPAISTNGHGKLPGQLPGSNGNPG